MRFVDLDKGYDRVKREALWQVLRIYDVVGTFLNGIKSMYPKRLARIGVKGAERECFRNNSVVRQGFIMSPWFFNVHMDAVMKKLNMRMVRMRVRFLEEGREWKLPGQMNWFCGRGTFR